MLSLVTVFTVFPVFPVSSHLICILTECIQLKNWTTLRPQHTKAIVWLEKPKMTFLIIIFNFLTDSLYMKMPRKKNIYLYFPHKTWENDWTPRDSLRILNIHSEIQLESSRLSLSYQSQSWRGPCWVFYHLPLPSQLFDGFAKNSRNWSWQLQLI